MKSIEKLNLKIQQGQETRNLILKTAKELFGKKGYSQTSTDDVLKSLKVTRGALYHHFKSKQEIFEEICRMDTDEFARDIRNWNWVQFTRKWPAILDMADDRTFIQIWIKDAPSVLSTATLLKIDEEFLVAPLKELLQTAMDNGLLKRNSAETVANLFLGMINQSLLVLSQMPAKEKNKMKKYFWSNIQDWLTSLQTANTR